ncbi:MAG: hypothetical protein EHM31_12530, partial [Candidatus Aminicenantes bacterium]
AVCLLAWPAAMAAATPEGDGSRIAPRGLEFRFDKDAFAAPVAQTGIAETTKFSRLSLKLYGGYSHILAADVNDGADFFFEIVELYAAEGMGTIAGGYKPLHGGFDFGADLIYQITPNIGVGLGAGFMRNSSRSLATWTFDTTETLIAAEPTISAIPVRLGVFFTVPVAGQVNLTADIGGAYYAGLKFDAVQRLESGANWSEMSVAGLTAGPSPLGFHGSLGLEYMISPKMGFFIEGAGRYAKLKNFDEVTGIENFSGGSANTTDGKLYIETQTDILSMYTISMFTIEETPPVDDADTTFREPKFDLSGFSLRAGFRIRF